MKNKNYIKITGIVFISVILLAFIANIIIPDKSFSPDENRILTKFPYFSLSKYIEGRFETKLENYANDQFLFRNSLIKVKSATDIAAGKLKSNGVFRCRDHYLMEDISEPDKKFQYTKNAMKQFNRQYSNINMYFLLAPNAANILKSKLPFTVKVKDQNKFIDEFYSEIQSFGYKPIDIRKSFKKNKDDVQLYYRTDHHWTCDGAYIAFKDAAKTMGMHNIYGYQSYVVKNDFKGTLYSKSGFVNGLDDEIKLYMPDKKKKFNNSVIYYSDTKEKTTKFYQLDNLKKKDAYTVFGGSNHPMYTIQTPNVNKKSLLLIKDSYANSFIPFLSQNYSRIIVVDPRYFYEDVNDLIDSYKVNDILFLYNANTFFQDNSLELMLSD